MTTGSIFFIVHSQAQLRTCPSRSETFNCRARSNNMTICSSSFGDFFQCDLDRIEGISIQRAPLYILLNRVEATTAQIENLSTEKDASGGGRHAFHFGLF